MKRTSLLHGVTFLFFVLLLGGVPILSIPQQASAQSNPIVLENQNPGTNNWRINYNTGTFSDDVAQQIKGYASATSVNHGGSINFHITVNPAQTYTIDVYRMGWYGGAGGRLMQSIANLNGTTQPACPILAATGTVECNWSVSHTLAVPASWTTGIYLAKLTNAQGFQSYIVFAVRDDNRVADFLYQQPVNTYQAYNNYPADNTTGKSLYDFNSFGPLTAAGTPRANKVSFNRPYGGNGGPDGGGQFADDQWWERYFISWAERMGYDISYTTDVDTHANPGRLLNFKGVIVAGHSEYWTKQMYDAVQNARDQGVSLAFLGANPVYFQVRLESSSTGSANRTLVSYKSLSLDPIGDPALRTALWRDLNRAEQQLVGVQFTIDGDFFATQPYIIKNSSHWVWANSGFVDGSVVPNLTGYEVDRLHAEYPAPNSLSYTTLAESPYTVTTSDPPRNDISQSSIYQAPSGAWVFAAGTMSWVWALDRPGFVSPGIQQAARNILDRFLAGTVSPTPTYTPVAATATPILPTSTPTNTPVVPTNTPTNTPVVPTNTPTNTPAVATSTPTNTPISPTSTPLPTATPLSGTIDRRISQSGDDGEQAYSTGATLLTSGDIEFGYDLGTTSVYQLCGLRFQNITVPRGATITSAYIEFATGTTDANGRGSLGIHGQASDNAPAFTTANYNLSNRPFTSAVVAWNNIPNWNVLGARNLTPSLRTIVQEIVNRNGWNSGNSLAFLIEGTGRHAAYAYDGRPSSAARLVIKWTAARMAVPEVPSDSQGNLDVDEDENRESTEGGSGRIYLPIISSGQP